MYSLIQDFGPGAFVVVADHIGGERKGMRYGWKEVETFPIELQLFDDDGELYYVVKASDWDYAELAFQWAMNDAGVTFSKSREGNGSWEPCFG